MEKHVLLFSGGIDSFVAYHFIRKELQKEVVPVYFDLGAPYNPREIRVVKSLLPETIIDTSLSVGDTQRDLLVINLTPLSNSIQTATFHLIQ